MKKWALVILLSTAVFGQFNRSPNITARFAGIVSDLKFISVDEQENVLVWVSAKKGYYISGKGHIPYIYLNDTLYEYWVNYQFKGIGTPRNYFIYEPRK